MLKKPLIVQEGYPFILGAFLISLFTKEYRSTGGSSPVIRFFLGVIMMVCALVFLGCPLRMILRRLLLEDQRRLACRIALFW